MSFGVFAEGGIRGCRHYSFPQVEFFPALLSCNREEQRYAVEKQDEVLDPAGTQFAGELVAQGGLLLLQFSLRE